MLKARYSPYTSRLHQNIVKALGGQAVGMFGKSINIGVQFVLKEDDFVRLILNPSFVGRDILSPQFYVEILCRTLEHWFVSCNFNCLAARQKRRHCWYFFQHLVLFRYIVRYPQVVIDHHHPDVTLGLGNKGLNDFSM